MACAGSALSSLDRGRPVAPMNVRLLVVLPSMLEGCSLGEEEDVVTTDVFEWCS